MVDLTDRLSLRMPVGSDPFLRSDFEYNWERLDDFPGYFPCTAGTHPSWGADQAGLLIVETDTGKILRWTGSAFVTPNIFPKAAVFSASPAVSISPTASYTQAMGSFTPLRACSIIVFGAVGLSCIPTAPAESNQIVKLDGTSIMLAGGFKRWPLSPYTGISAIESAAIPVFAYATGVTAASHALTVVVDNPDLNFIGAPSITLLTVNLTVIYLD